MLIDLFIYFYLFIQACSITYVILHAMIIYITLSTPYTLMFFCLFVCLIYITLPTLYTLMFLCPINHPAVIDRNLLIQ